MKRALKSLLAVMVTASIAAAQNASPQAGASPAVPTDNAAPAQAVAPVPTPAPTADYAYRSVSPGVAEALSMDRPKFNPPTPTPVAVNEPEDMRTVDKPKNDIPRLPSYIVRDTRPP